MIEILDVSKAYKHKVLDSININVSPNNICCLLGKNGAGKSTLLNIITQNVIQDSGVIKINSQTYSTNETEISKIIGAVTNYSDLITELTGYQYLVFRGLTFGLTKSVLAERIGSLSEYLFDNHEDIHKIIASYSTGMQMKLKIISSMLHNPQILILDEPFSNLDPVAADKLMTLLKNFARKQNNLILISSHDLAYVDKIASQICVLHESRIVFNGTREEFTSNDSKDISATLLGLINPERKSLEQLDWLV
ncbi:ABC transporter ATP-binding protein [Dyadobacter crusticola]|uniref:ABC transporter ATP-binding protein n=1 Tax=Dyadobacter crusticola TaxID=292407 RepID=UPI0004E12BB6|nr:ABC transporter ATP-binding protein [Dyadobacter crusticola]